MTSRRKILKPADIWRDIVQIARQATDNKEGYEEDRKQVDSGVGVFTGHAEENAEDVALKGKECEDCDYIIKEVPKKIKCSADISILIRK